MKPNRRRYDDLEIEEDLSYQHRAWMIHRVAYWVFCLILIAALCGLFGRGGLSHQKKANSDGSLILEYERFLHLESPETLKLQVLSSNMQGPLQIWIANSYVDAIQIQRVTPEPEFVQAQGERLVYQFAISKMNPSVLIKFHFQPESAGRLTGSLGIANGPELAFQQFIYP